MPKENLIFLDQSQYSKDVGNTAMSDFRHVYKADFTTVLLDEKDECLHFVLKAIKP